MPLLRLSEEQIAQFEKIPETAMDLHVVEGTLPDGRHPWWFVIGCSILMISDDEAREQISVLFREGRAMWQRTGDAARNAFEGWRNHLRSTSEFPGAITMAHMVIHPAHRVYRPLPMPPIGVYGHLPFVGTTQVNETYYR